MDECQTILDCLRHWAGIWPDRVAIRHGAQTLSYAELLRETELRAQWLINRGVARSDRVLIVGFNTIDWVTAYLGVMRAGAIAVLANNRLTPTQMRDLVTLLDARLALVDLKHQYMFALANVAIDALEAWGRPTSLALPLPPTGDDPVIISFTSGTTAQPKGAVLSASALYEASAIYQRFLNTGQHDSTIILAPLFHNTGFIDQLGQMLMVGGEIGLVTEFHRNDAIEAFRLMPSTFVTAVPSVLRMLMLMDESELVFGPARIVVFGGSPMPEAWSREMSERWPHLELVHGYGLTEFGSACTFLPPAMIHEHGESVGYPAPGVGLRLVDDKGNDVPQGAVGEIWVAGPTRMLEYWRRPDETARKITGNWLRTGDLGRVDAAGRLYLIGRLDDVINRGGEKILPSRVESLLSDCSCIANCAVVGVPDPILQQVPVAVIELRRGCSLKKEDIITHLAANLPSYAMPQRFMTVDRLPCIASGKLDRRAIRDLAIADQAA